MTPVGAAPYADTPAPEYRVLRDGGVVRVRPVRPGDGPALLDLHRRLSREAVYLRYLSARRVLPERQLERFTHVDGRDRMGFVVELGSQLIAHACYERGEDGDPDAAEVAFEVEDAHWGRGLATLLLVRLAARARACGIRRFTAHVLPENRRMLEVFRDAGLREVARFEKGLVAVVLELGAAPAAPVGMPLPPGGGPGGGADPVP